jgi:hypothetical protein
MTKLKTQMGFNVYIHHCKEFEIDGEYARDLYKWHGWKLTKVFADNSEELIKEKRRKE